MLEHIGDNDELYRRVAPVYIKQDGSISSKAFYFKGKPDPSVSVDLGRLTTKRESVNRARKPDFGLGVLIARNPRIHGFNVHHSPDDENENFSHSLIQGENTKELCYRLAEFTILDSIRSN